MQARNIIIIIAVFFVFIGVFLTGTGITGMVTMDDTIKPLCSADADCKNSVCCKFYQEDSGVCDQIDRCDLVYSITKAEKEQQKKYLNIENSVQDKYSAFIIIGGVVAMISIYAFYLLMKQAGTAVSPAVKKRKAKS